MIINKKKNLIPELITDIDWTTLAENNFLSKTGVKYYILRRDYKKARETGKAGKVLDKMATKRKMKSATLGKIVQSNYRGAEL